MTIYEFPIKVFNFSFLPENFQSYWHWLFSYRKIVKNLNFYQKILITLVSYWPKQSRHQKVRESCSLKVTQSYLRNILGISQRYWHNCNTGDSDVMQVRSQDVKESKSQEVNVSQCPKSPELSLKGPKYIPWSQIQLQWREEKSLWQWPQN